MTCEQCIITKVSPGQFEITGRVQLACELLEAPDDQLVRVRILEPGAGLAVGAEITVPTAKVTV